MSADEHIEELLSGFLDGELSAGELRELELAMSAAPSLRVKLEQLRQLGDDLRSVPKRKLGADFTERIVAAAQREGLGGSAPVQIAPKLPLDVDKARRWKRMGVVVALAATLLFAFFAYKGVQSLNLPTGEDLAESPLGELPSNNIASEQAPEAESKSEALVRNDPNMRKRVATQNGFTVLTIMEIEPSAKAWKENEVSKILKEAGIIWTNPVMVSDDVIEVLNTTRSINQGLPKAGNEPLALVMVMARGRTMDKALKRILGSVDVFPHVLLDMAFDLPGKELCQKLVNAQLTVAEGQQAAATPIVAGTIASGNVVNGGLESFSQFSSAPPAKYLAPSMRHSEPENMILADEENAMSYVLLVIRHPAK
jgi:negative regulator of sigma E activity